MEECNCVHLNQMKKVFTQKSMTLDPWYFAAFGVLIVSLFIIWTIGLWNGSDITYASYDNNYFWATRGVIGLFSSLALILLFFSTMIVGWNNTPSMYRTMNYVQYFLFYLQFVLYIIVSGVLFRIKTNGNKSTGAETAFSILIVAVVVGVIQLTLQCFVVSNGGVGNSGAKWIRVIIPMLLYLTWVVVMIAVTYHMWKDGFVVVRV